MKISKLFLGAILALLCCQIQSSAQETHQHKHEMEKNWPR